MTLENRTEQETCEEEAVKKLCSVGYQHRFKKTLLKIMAMPLMEHEGDIFNDGVRIAALTIDIRYSKTTQKINIYEKIFFECMFFNAISENDKIL